MSDSKYADYSEWLRSMDEYNAKPDDPKEKVAHAARDDKFWARLLTIGELHDKKMQDYGIEGDPYHNVRSSQDFGVRPWVGGLTRLNDKVVRLKAYAKKGVLANESVKDSLLDIAVYALISLELYEQEEADASST